MILQRIERAGFKIQRSLIECLAREMVCRIHTAETEKLENREVVLRVSVSDARREAVERFTKEFAPLITSGPPGIAGYATGRPQVRPVFAYWPTLVPKKFVQSPVSIKTAAEIIH